MKKLLSAILAITMCMALIPAAAVAADTEAADGVISYKITSAAVDKTTTWTYPTPVDVPVDAEGKAIDIETDANEDGFVDSDTNKDGFVTEADEGVSSVKIKKNSSGTLVEKTIFNTLANLQDVGNKIGNGEKALVSYRTRTYNKIGAYIVRTPYSGSKTYSEDYTAPATIDLAYTAPFELYGRNNKGGHNQLCDAGMYQTIIVSDEDMYEELKWKNRFNYFVRIKVEKPGNYKVRIYNSFTNNDKYTYSIDQCATLDANTPYAANAWVSTQVSYAKLDAGDEFEWLQSSYSKISGAQKNGTDMADLAINEMISGFEVLGTYNAKVGESVKFDKSVTLEAGEYLIAFDTNENSFANNSTLAPYTTTASTTSTTYYQNFLLSGIDLIPVSEEELAMRDAAEEAKEVTEEGLSGESYVNVIAKNIEDDEAVETVKKISATRGENVTVKADEISGYDFLYWRSGLGVDAKVITNNPECTVKAIPGTWLTAVYKKADSEKVSVLFYNADGDIIENKLVVKDAQIIFPENPTAPAGCGEFTGWALNTKDNIVTTATATGSSMVFVAQFKDSSEKDIPVAVPDGATGGGNYAYGDEVTVTADATSGEEKFAYWKKGDEVVSFDASYTFNAWEACELTAVYLAEVPTLSPLRKIILKGGIAEFIGLDAAAEKGVIFKDDDETEVTLGNATHKIAMTTDGNHLAFNNDLEDSGKTNYIGYAILANGNVIYDK